MTDPEIEDLLRETIQAREAQAFPISRVRPKPRRPRRAAWIGAGAATLAVLGGAIFAAGALRGPAPSALEERPLAPGGLWPGWKWQSSNGAEIQVPDAWPVVESLCGPSTPGRTVVSGMVMPAILCAEQPGSDLAMFIENSPSDEPGTAPRRDLVTRAVTVHGVPAVRQEWRWEDGRYAGSLRVESRRVGVDVRTTDQATTAHILDSFRLVDVDHLGCATARPSWPADLPPGGALALPQHAARLVVCDYSGTERLRISQEVSGAAVDPLLDALRAAEPGANGAPPAARCMAEPLPVDVVLQPAGSGPIGVYFTGCLNRGITDGIHSARITTALLGKIMTGRSTAYIGSLD